MPMTTVTGLYDNYDAAARTVRDLEDSDIPRADISLVAHGADNIEQRDHDASDAGTGASAGASAGAVVGGSAGLLAGLGMLAIPGVGPVVAAGWLVATAAGAVAGAAAGAATGGLIGSLTSAGVSNEHAQVYAEGVRRGGALVTVRVDDMFLSAAENILSRHGRIDIASRERAYRDAGWTAFSDKSPPYDSAEAARERAMYRGGPSV